MKLDNFLQATENQEQQRELEGHIETFSHLMVQALEREQPLQVSVYIDEHKGSYEYEYPAEIFTPTLNYLKSQLETLVKEFEAL